MYGINYSPALVLWVLPNVQLLLNCFIVVFVFLDPCPSAKYCADQKRRSCSLSTNGKCGDCIEGHFAIEGLCVTQKGRPTLLATSFKCSYVKVLIRLRWHQLYCAIHHRTSSFHLSNFIKFSWRSEHASRFFILTINYTLLLVHRCYLYRFIHTLFTQSYVNVN